MRSSILARPYGRPATIVLTISVAAALLLPLLTPIDRLRMAPTDQHLAPATAPRSPAQATSATTADAFGANEEVFIEPQLDDQVNNAFAAPRPAPLETVLDQTLAATGRGDAQRPGWFAGPAVLAPLGITWIARLPDGIYAAPIVTGPTVYVSMSPPPMARSTPSNMHTAGCAGATRPMIGSWRPRP